MNLPAKLREMASWHTMSPLLVFLAMLLTVSVLNSAYLGPLGISIVTASAAPILLVALGQAMVLNIGSIDLSNAAISLLGSILLALAQDAFETLARRIEENRSDDPLEALKAVMVEYAAFGLGNPNEYRIVFMTEKVRPQAGKTFAEMTEGNPAMKVLVARVEACVAAGKLRGDPRAIATMLWAVGHGTISLLITFPFYPFGDPQAFVARMCEFSLASLGAGDVPPLAQAPGC